MNSIKRFAVSLFSLASVVLLLAGVVPTAFAQNDAQYRMLKAADYAKWRAKLTSNVAAGGTSFTVSPCYFTPNGPGATFTPFTAQTPLTLAGATVETVVPTAVSSPTQSSSLPGGCSITVTATVTYAHSAGAVVTSGDGGIAEAAAAVKKGTVILDGASGSATAIGSIPVANGFVTLRDDHSAGSPQYYRVGPSTLSLIAAGAAPVNTAITGSLSSGVYYTTYKYVDLVGGMSLPATDSTQTGTVTGISMASPAASTGAVGYIPMVTAASGGTGTEIEVPVTSSVCTVVTVETVIPACAIGSAALIKANPSATAKVPGFGTAHTTFAWLPTGSSPWVSPLGAFQTVYGPFTSITATTGGVDAAQFYIPAGTLNSLGKTIDICFKVNATDGSSGGLNLLLTAANQYGQSPVTLDTLVGAVASGATITDVGCFTISVAATGSSGTFWASGTMTQTNASGPASTVGGDITTAVSSAVDLTKGIYFSLQGKGAVASATGVIVNSLTIRPASGS